jgi:class 3 adenylate cyclase
MNFLLEVKEKYSNNIKAGITYGTVYSGIIGNEKRCSYDVLGSVVNLSSRFMTGADLGKYGFQKTLTKYRR